MFCCLIEMVAKNPASALGAATSLQDLAAIPGNRLSAQYWMNLQTAYEIEVAQREAGQSIEREVLPRSA